MNTLNEEKNVEERKPNPHINSLLSGGEVKRAGGEIYEDEQKSKPAKKTSKKILDVFFGESEEEIRQQVVIHLKPKIRQFLKDTKREKNVKSVSRVAELILEDFVRKHAPEYLD